MGRFQRSYNLIMKKLTAALLFIILAVTAIAVAGTRRQNPISNESVISANPDVSPAAPATTTKASIPNADLPAVTAAQAWIAQDMNVAESDVYPVQIAKQTWPDSCMGLAGEGDVCKPEPVTGYKILFRIEHQKYLVEVHTDLDGKNIVTGGAVVNP